MKVWILEWKPQGHLVQHRYFATEAGAKAAAEELEAAATRLVLSWISVPHYYSEELEP